MDRYYTMAIRRHMFMEQMVMNQRYDPLSIFWYALAYETYYKQIQSPLLNDPINKICANECMCIAVCEIYKRGKFRHASMHSPFLSSGMRHGTWGYLGENGNSYYVRSNEFIKRAATFAFLCMRVRCGRDVAGIIARKVAKIYLDDYAWMQTVPISLRGEGMVRERLAARGIGIII